MKKIIVLTICFLMTHLTSLYAQDPAGMWEVEKVMVGDRLLTPVAKWMKLHSDHSYQSGNGWLQNDIGTWQYDANNHLLSMHTSISIKDEYEPFQIEITQDEMTWKRTEDGMQVTVNLKRIDSLPSGTADLLLGLWDLEKIEDQGQEVTAEFDPENKYYLFMRWDRIYSERTPDGQKQSGYWHINGHQPIITLLPHQSEQTPLNWQVKVNQTSLTLKGLSEINKSKTMYFTRIQEFPQ
ncbi:hypothetical protein [Echinicola sp. 20G]|uniref:hypothetical protein n=1 Tax=Echinicola sp. 20G TaxID=2781961 RepID=UPI00190FC908|nr:hypothetical protein [Echinicola sp. 20G]